MAAQPVGLVLEDLVEQRDEVLIPHPRHPRGCRAAHVRVGGMELRRALELVQIGLDGASDSSAGADFTELFSKNEKGFATRRCERFFPVNREEGNVFLIVSRHGVSADDEPGLARIGLPAKKAALAKRQKKG